MVALHLHLCPNEGLFGVHIRRGNKNVHFKDLNYDERDKIIRQLEDVLKIYKAQKFNNL